jgi:hypothetical protein
MALGSSSCYGKTTLNGGVQASEYLGSEPVSHWHKRYDLSTKPCSVAVLQFFSFGRKGGLH